MEMGAGESIKTIEPKGELYACPTCGYTDGFHVSFNMKSDTGAEIILICPECSARFRLGWSVEIG